MAPSTKYTTRTGVAWGNVSIKGGEGRRQERGEGEVLTEATSHDETMKEELPLALPFH